MMAIDGHHRIMKLAQSKGVILPDQKAITANDLFHRTANDLYKLITSGSGSGSDEMLHDPKRPRFSPEVDNDNDTMKLLAIQKLPDVQFYSGRKVVGDDKLQLAWKLRLLMCVDAKPSKVPIIFHNVGTTGFEELIAVGSQGGDICIANSKTGKAVCRMNVEGKIEGEMSCFITTRTKEICSSRNGRTRTAGCILYVCSYDVQYSAEAGHAQRFGYINAFEISCQDIDSDGDEGGDDSGTNKMELEFTTRQQLHVTSTRLWRYAVNGEIKNKPIVFSLPQLQLQHQRLLIASYNGDVLYFDAMTGKILDKLDDGSLGGAIHADPVVIITDTADIQENNNQIQINAKTGVGSRTRTRTRAKAIIASSTWIGKVSCLSLDKDSIKEVQWQIDINSPIYATPLPLPLYHSESHSDANSYVDGNADLNLNVIFIFAIDGSLRLIDLDSGTEKWVKTNIAKRPIFSSGCFIHVRTQDKDKDKDKHETKTKTKTLVAFGSHDSLVRCVNLDGEIEWTFDANAAITTTPLPIDNGKRLIVSTAAGIIYSLNSETGLVDKEPLQLDGEIFSSPCTGSGSEPEEIYVGCRDSCIYKIWA